MSTIIPIASIRREASNSHISFGALANPAAESDTDAWKAAADSDAWPKADMSRTSISVLVFVGAAVTSIFGLKTLFFHIIRFGDL